jgi:2-polyprenyl-6-methoxyphenol hydroxylase-like FAD-dependent oxidoreductase
MRDRPVLIAGLGVAGPTLAYWLGAAGFEPTVIERAPALRRGGYVIDFWGLGYDVAERMGLPDKIGNAGWRMRELQIVDDRGERLAGFGARVFRR